MIPSALRWTVASRALILGCILLRTGALPLPAAETPAGALPPGVRAEWGWSTAHRDTTPTREKLSLNGLWRWQPAESAPEAPPAGGWGWFKVPGCWPGITDYLQKDSQTVHPHPDWRDTRLGSLTAAWYDRSFEIPPHWEGRRVVARFTQVHSLAAVFIDGVRVGEIRFPAGEIELTHLCRPGTTHRLSLHVSALPLKAVLQSYTDSASAREVRGAVARRGLCGDAELVSFPQGPRVEDPRATPSIRRQELQIRARLHDLPSGRAFHLRVRLSEEQGQTRDFSSPPFTAGDLDSDGAWAFVCPWMPRQFWDLGDLARFCRLEVSLHDDAGQRLDVAHPVRFGFREFEIEGRDFLLNGSRVFLCAVPLDNAQVGAAWATYDAARETLRRLQSFGINFVYTHHYGCEPGAHLGLEEILRAADDAGMLVALTQPHFSHYDWKSPDADTRNGYAEHAAYYARVAGNHPSVVMYAMSHNATGYAEDMNPDLIDGQNDVRDSWASRNVLLARRAEAIVHRLDPGRIPYHHASGNLGPMHAVNFYPNFVPQQELAEWFGHWSTQGSKPLFLCEYGAPFSWDWTLYRGWFQGRREFGSARVPWEFALAEWNAQFLGDGAFPASPTEQANLRWEAAQFRSGNLWHRWDYPAEVGSTRLEERYPIFAAYLTGPWRAFRTWEVSALSPWEYGHFWKPRPGAAAGAQSYPVDWDHLQRPGFSPDAIASHYPRFDLGGRTGDWIPTPAAEALLRNNGPRLAWIAGPPAHFTAQDHLFQPGEPVLKQVVVLNNSRRTEEVEVEWSVSLDAGRSRSGAARFSLPTGQQQRVPVSIPLPEDLLPGDYTLRAAIRFTSSSSSETQEDSFAIHVLTSPPAVAAPGGVRLALFDPLGETGRWLNELGIAYRSLPATASLEETDVLVVGKGALTPTGPFPNLDRVRSGLRVLVFEQSAAALEQRLGFRVAEYGLRRVFPRSAGHPILAGLGADSLCDWRGEATLQPARLTFERDPRLGPTVTWCGFRVPHLWRCGNRGNVASVLIEKPTRGDFLPLLDGGFGLQYSPLLQYREGAGCILFCQLDVTGRTEPDPVADTLARNALRHMLQVVERPVRQAQYAGEPGGWRHLQEAGFRLQHFDPARLTPETVLVLGPGAGPEVLPHAERLEAWSRAGGRFVGLGLSSNEVSSPVLEGLQLRSAEHLSTSLPLAGPNSPLAGIGPADLHVRDPRATALIRGGAEVWGGGTLGIRTNGVLSQLAPWRFEGEAMNLRRTRRRLAFVTSRVLANAGLSPETPLLDRFTRPAGWTPGGEPSENPTPRWRDGLYLEPPVEWDDPYRFFRW